MKWQYRTILFEFRKDGLLGDRYIDDEEMHKVLNEQGEKGWELVSVTPVQEGLLSFFKKGVLQAAKQVIPQPEETAPQRIPERPQPTGRGLQKPAHRPENTSSAAQKEVVDSNSKPDGVGGIKIS